MRRRDRPEEMDRPDADPSELDCSLDQLAQINRWLGGWWSVRQALRAVRLPAWKDAVVLDVATGGGDIARAVAHRFRREGVRIVALDLHPVTLEHARRHTPSGCPVAFLRADALALPVRSGGVDVALCSLAAHHFSAGELVTLLRELKRVARSAVVVADLRRSRLAWVLIWLLTRVIWRSRIVQHDGPVSVARAYTPREFAELARQAGLDGATILRQPLFRMAVIYRK